MSQLEDPSSSSAYQFSRWSTTICRPHSSLPSKDAVTDMFKLGIDNRNQPQRLGSSSLSRRTIRHHVRIPTGSPPLPTQPTSTPDLNSSFDSPSPYVNVVPVRIKSNALTIPILKTKEENLSHDFPKQNHEQRKLTYERKRRKHQAQILAEKYAESETWFQLRRSLAELKRLATSQDILIDPSTSDFNCDGNSFAALKQVMAQQQEDKKMSIFKSDSVMSSSMGSTLSSRDFTRASMTTSQQSFKRRRTPRRLTETYPRLVYEPLLVGLKPIHPSQPTSQYNLPIKTKLKPPSSAPLRPRFNSTAIPLSEERRAQLLLSDLSNEDNPPVSLTPSPPMIKIEKDIPSRKNQTPSPTRLRPPSTAQLTSTIKLKSQPPRCHSATDIKSSYSTNKNFPRFILIADQEHRIESWYHQYPFILSDDLLTSFQSKQTPTISAFFIDDLQISNPNVTPKVSLQGKPFHINNDWKKYDLIFISNNIYEDIIIYLQTIINLIQSSGKIIKIYQINHQEDLKKQVRHICKQLQQQN